MLWEKLYGLIGFRTGDLQVCSIVPQPTRLLPAQLIRPVTFRYTNWLALQVTRGSSEHTETFPLYEQLTSGFFSLMIPLGGSASLFIKMDTERSSVIMVR
jgi:hypothetical protein